MPKPTWIPVQVGFFFYRRKCNLLFCGHFFYCSNESVSDISLTTLILSFAICMILHFSPVLIVNVMFFAFLSQIRSTALLISPITSSGCLCSPAHSPNNSSTRRFAVSLRSAASWYTFASSHSQWSVAHSSRCGSVIPSPSSTRICCPQNLHVPCAAAMFAPSFLKSH